MADGDAPAALANGIETCWRCQRCGAGIVPRSHKQKWCSSTCRFRWWLERNTSYRRTRAALRKRGLLTPEVEARISTLKGRGIVSVDEIKRLYASCGLGRPRPAKAHAEHDPSVSTTPWTEPSPSLTTPLCTALAYRIPARRALNHFAARLLHGAFSHALKIEHQPGRPTFGLVLPTRERWGWVLCYDAVAESLRTMHAPLGSSTFLIEFGARSRLRPPPRRNAGSYRVRVTTESALVFANRSAGLNFALPQRVPKDLESQLRAIAMRLRIETPNIVARVVSCDLESADVLVGGHIQIGYERGVVGASWGSLIVECNATGRWLLDCAALVGLGGKTAFGFGRVRVEDA